ncbi:MAG: NUDIX domain-containing protein [Lachnospiraceae bacterium]|nr:NUDIX domain-containing protein [Lachnospiraceae bacterium]
MTEYWDLYDGAGQLTGEKHLRGTAVPKGKFHKVVHIWIQNSKGKLLLQKRSDTVDNCPGEWATTGGSVQAGEEPLTTAVRELSEELGLTVSAEELQYCLMVRRKDAFCYVYVLKKDVPAESLSLQECEVAAAEWMSPETMDRMVAERTMHRYVYREMLDLYFKN